MQVRAQKIVERIGQLDDGMFIPGPDGPNCAYAVLQASGLIKFKKPIYVDPDVALLYLLNPKFCNIVDKPKFGDIEIMSSTPIEANDFVTYGRAPIPNNYRDVVDHFRIYITEKIAYQKRGFYYREPIGFYLKEKSADLDSLYQSRFVRCSGSMDGLLERALSKSPEAKKIVDLQKKVLSIAKSSMSENNEPENVEYYDSLKLEERTLIRREHLFPYINEISEFEKSYKTYWLKALGHKETNEYARYLNTVKAMDPKIKVTSSNYFRLFLQHPDYLKNDKIFALSYANYILHSNLKVYLDKLRKHPTTESTESF